LSAKSLVSQPGSAEQRGFAYQRTPPPDLVAASFMGTFLTRAMVRVI
jgi:hypothetical protein